MDLRAVEEGLVDGCFKGMPGGIAAMPLSAVGARCWNLLAEDLPLPACVLKQSAIAHNEGLMRAFLDGAHAAISPHGKTTMAPQLFARQLAGGAWAMTVGTVHQLQVARAFGCPRVVLANQLVGRQGIRFVLDEMARDPAFEFYCLADSVANVEQIAAAARARNVGRPINLFLEGGFVGGRTGCRSLAEAETVARAVKAAEPHLSLRGVEGFEGLMGDPAQVEAFLAYLCDIARMIDALDLAGAGPLILTAGGSAFYDLVARHFGALNLRRPTRLLTRSGCYLTHDSAMYEDLYDGIAARTGWAERPRPAIEVWAYVQSRPEPTRALVTMGKRDASWDHSWPKPLHWARPGDRVPRPMPAGHRITGMNDQHGYLDLPADSPLAVGDMVAFGISHPCLTFDRWQLIHLVDDDYTVTGAIRTYF